MPPFFGQAHFYSALQSEALPALERIAAGDTMRGRSLNRFERDDSPPYTSSTESENFDDDFPKLQSNGCLPQELTAIMEPPLTDEEIGLLAITMNFATDPSASYRREARYEEKRLRDYRPFLVNPLFRGKYGNRRAGVLIRHYIKRRWEKLGIWNPEWGIPTRNEQRNDNIKKWRWRWEEDKSDGSDLRGSEAVNAPYKGEVLVERALRLRQNIRRGESSPVVPRSRLTQDASASEAESFIISRPWITHKIEVAEEKTRFWRLDPKHIRFYQHPSGKQVVEWWKERGDWREKFDLPDGSTLVNSWKWRHESPSPEPEDLTPIDNIKDSPLDSIDIDFTPSEIDALEAIPPLGHLSPPIAPTEAKPRLPRLLFNPFEPREMSQNPHQDASQEPKIQLLELQGNASRAPPQETQCQLRDEWRDADQDQGQNQPPPRRSARIAGTKRPADSVPSELAPNKKHKGKAIPRAAALQTRPATRETEGRTQTPPVLTSPAPSEEMETQPRRGRGRPRKKNTRTAVAKEMPVLAKGKRGKAIATDPPTVPRRGRRSGKTE